MVSALFMLPNSQEPFGQAAPKARWQPLVYTAGLERSIARPLEPCAKAWNPENERAAVARIAMPHFGSERVSF